MILPPKLGVGDFPGPDYAERWKAFLEGIYQVFLRDVAHGHLSFQGKPVKCRYHEPYDGKHYSFWHLMSQGKEEQERTPDLERCAPNSVDRPCHPKCRRCRPCPLVGK